MDFFAFATMNARQQFAGATTMTVTETKEDKRIVRYEAATERNPLGYAKARF